MPNLLPPATNPSNSTTLKNIIASISGIFSSIFGSFLKISAILALPSMVPTFLIKATVAILPAFLVTLATTNNLVIMATAVAASLLIPSSILFPLAALNFMLAPIAMLSSFVANAFFARAAAYVAAVAAAMTYHPADNENIMSQENRANFDAGVRAGARFYDSVTKAPGNAIWAFNNAKNKFTSMRGQTPERQRVQSRHPALEQPIQAAVATHHIS